MTPHSLQAERAVLGRMMASGDRVAGEIVGTLRTEDFFDAGHRALYEQIVENYYADAPLDPLTVAQARLKLLTGIWGVDDNDAMVRVRQLASSPPPGSIRDHAAIIRDEANKRRLLEVAASIHAAVEEGTDPEQAASIASEEAMRIATDRLLSYEIKPFGGQGRQFLARMRSERDAVAQGAVLGARFGLRFIDRYVRGLREEELMILGGEPGVGKTSVAWRAALNFAESQARMAREPKVGTLILSLEMGEDPSNARVAQMLTGISGVKIRDAALTDREMQRITNEWGRRRSLPLWFNYTSTLKESQLRALVVEAIRRHNVGLVILDHFKHLHTDQRFRSAIDMEEQKATFLKTAIAEDLGVAVMVLAHTTKGIVDSPDRRPHLTHLRGSYQLAAIADIVAFVHRPIMHATQEEGRDGRISERDAEFVVRKNRNGSLGESPFDFNGETMEIAE